MGEAGSMLGASARAALVFACGILAASLPSIAEAETSDTFTKYQRKNRETADKVIETLYSNERAILIVATLGMKHKYPTEALLDDNLADEVTDTGRSAAVEYSMAMDWINLSDPDSMVVVAQNVMFAQIGPSGFFYRFETGGNDYMVFVVEPGTYSLSKIGYPRPRSKLGEGHGIVNGRSNQAIGELRQVASNMLEAEQTMVFLNAASTTVAASEQCNWWYKGVCTQSVYTPEHTRQTRAAGLYPKTEYLPIPAVDVGIKFNDHVASFDVGAGEVILVDGLFPQPLETDMGVSDCRSGESMQVCALHSIELTRARGSVEQVRAFDFAAELFPRLAKLIGKVEYRPLKVQGVSAGESRFGEKYLISR